MKVFCPCCKNYIRWKDRREFSTFIGFRKPSFCPCCNSQIIWREYSYSLLIFSGYLYIMGFLIGGEMVFNVFSLLAILFLVAGIARLKLVLYIDK